MNNIDLNTYIPLPMFSVAGALSVTEALISNMPRTRRPGVMRAAKQLRETAEELRIGWRAKAGKEHAHARRRRRQADRTLDLSWSILRSRLDACARMPEDMEPLSPRIEQIIDELWPDGMKFLLDDYFDELEESKRLLALIDSKGWADDIDKAAGSSAYLAFIRKSQVEQEDLLRMSTNTPKVHLGKLLQRLRERMAGYVLQMVAWSAAMPGQVRMIEKALAPIETYRQMSTEHHKVSEEHPDLPPVNPEQPIAPIPEA